MKPTTGVKVVSTIEGKQKAVKWFWKNHIPTPPLFPFLSSEYKVQKFELVRQVVSLGSVQLFPDGHVLVVPPALLLDAALGPGLQDPPLDVGQVQGGAVQGTVRTGRQTQPWIRGAGCSGRVD